MSNARAARPADGQKAKILRRRLPKVCDQCHKVFAPTGANSKRCSPCGVKYERERLRRYWREHYVRKERDQRGEKNNAWRGGRSPAYYQKVAFSHYGRVCQRCADDTGYMLVHHRNGDRADNRVENLEPLCKRCHQLEHDCAGNLPAVVVFKPRVCVACGVTYEPTGARGHRCPACRAAALAAGHGTHASRIYQPRECERCRNLFTPTGPRSRRCPPCRRSAPA